ncbi:MAG: phytanoyl-CoA dioxygenase family protein [Gammaproteobacteria bacterium]|nr:phytanoyl-CoA dioxygenase family protein [Gammaproteobacteria bacterium]
MLTDDEVTAYGVDGVVIPSGFQLSADEVLALEQAVERTVRNNADTDSDMLMNVHLNEAPPFHLQGDKAFADLVRDTRILDMVEQLIGSDIILWSTHLFCKAASTGREVPWHQDGQYWPIRPLATCTAWVAIDQCEVENGALRVLPGSHKMGRFSHRTDNSPGFTLNQVIDDERFDEQDARYLTLRPGQLSLHDVQLLHGSAANRSGRRRAGLAIRFMPATSTMRRDLDMSKVSKLDWRQLPLSLMRGQDRGGNDLNVGHP